MKLLFPIVLAFFVFSANAAVDKTVKKLVRGMVTETLEKCAAKTKATKANVAEVLKLKIPKSHAGKCMLFCVNRELKGQNYNGSTNLQGALNSVRHLKYVNTKIHKQVTTILEKCEKTPRSKDRCVYAADITACLMKEARTFNLHKLIQE